MTTRSVAFMPTDLEALAHAVGVLHTDPHPLSIHNIATAIGTTALAWIATTVLTKDGFFQHLLITSTTDRKRKFRVKGGQQLICDQDAQTAAALFRRDVDALYHRKEFTL